jgi:hypothetical protein
MENRLLPRAPVDNIPVQFAQMFCGASLFCENEGQRWLPNRQHALAANMRDSLPDHFGSAVG